MKLLEEWDQLLSKFLLNIMSLLTLNKLVYDYMLNFYYEMSTRKLCSTLILTDSKIFPDLFPLPIFYYETLDKRRGT